MQSLHPHVTPGLLLVQSSSPSHLSSSSFYIILSLWQIEVGVEEGKYHKYHFKKLEISAFLLNFSYKNKQISKQTIS